MKYSSAGVETNVDAAPVPVFTVVGFKKSQIYYIYINIHFYNMNNDDWTELNKAIYVH